MRGNEMRLPFFIFVIEIKNDLSNSVGVGVGVAIVGVVSVLVGVELTVHTEAIRGVWFPYAMDCSGAL